MTAKYCHSDVSLDQCFRWPSCTSFSPDGHFRTRPRRNRRCHHIHSLNGQVYRAQYILVHSNSYPLLEHSPLSLAIGSSPIINSMARIKRTHSEEAASAAEKKRSIQQRISGGRITQPASSAAAATQGTGANSSETPRAKEGAASMVPTRLSSRSRKAPAFLGDFSQSPGRRSHVPGQANRSDGDNDLAPPKPSDDHQSARSGNIPDTAVGSFIPETAVEEEGTADGDEDAGGDKLIASDVDPDYEKSDSKDDEEIPDEEEAAEEIADEVLEAANGDEDAGGDKYIASDDDPDYEKSESEDEEEIDEEAPPL